jgi:hypothetical protein
MMKRIIFFLCCLFICCIPADAWESQETSKVTIQFKNQSLDSALCQLEKLSEYRFIYQDRIVDSSAKVDKKFKDKTLSQILDVLITKTDYDYVIFHKGKRIVFYEKVENSSKTPQNQKSMPFSATGTVVDEKGKFVPAASVYIKGEDYLSTAVLTDKNGSFTISTTDRNAYVIVLYIGYLPRIIHIQDAEMIQLEPDPILESMIFITD